MTASPSRKPSVGVFDFDGTLTWCDSFLPFLREAVGLGRFWFGLLCCLPVLAAHAAGLVGNRRAKEALLRHFLRGWTETRLRAVGQRFVAGRLLPLVNPAALERLRWHQGRGDAVIIVSASLESYLKIWAQQVGVTSVCATQLEWAGEQLTGRISGENCHGPEKVRRLKDHLGDLEGYHLYAYGDSASDRFILAAAQEPFFRSFARAGVGRWRAHLQFVLALF